MRPAAPPTPAAPSATKRRFVGEIVDDRGEPLIRDLFGPDRPPRRASCEGNTPPVGTVVQVDRGTATEGDDPGARIEVVLASAGSARAELYRIAADAALDPTFPDAVESEVEHWLARPGLEEPDLEDLEHLAFVTIDDARTRDLDQALYIERREDGYEAFYALADASWYVRPGSALFDEALRRGASYYLPGLVVPMLPRALSEGLVSLNEGVLRRALVFQMHVDAAGEPVRTRLRRGRIRSRGKLSFEEVQSFYDEPSPDQFEPEVVGSLELLRELGELRMLRAEQRDVVQYRRTEVDVGLAEPQGMSFVAVAESRGPVERYNEQLSLLCNMEGARLLRRGDQPDDLVQPIYRVHPQPEPDRVADFEALTHALARTRGLSPAQWAWQADSEQSLAAYLAGLPTAGPQGRLARAIHRQAVLLNVRSSFSESAAGHYGVGADVYARFSSPMREVVGVFVHKEAWEKITGKPLDEPAAQSTAPPSPSRVDDEELRPLVVDSANRAKQTQKRLDKEGNRLVLDQVLGDDAAQPLGSRPRRGGIVLGLTRSKAHVLLEQPPVEVKVYVRDLEQQRGQRLSIDDLATELRPDAGGPAVCKLGDDVEVMVRGQERHRGQRRWVLELRAR